jgi:DNA-binding IscR family transcriptional regulator
MHTLCFSAINIEQIEEYTMSLRTRELEKKDLVNSIRGDLGCIRLWSL